jgi:hypothetical protein
VPLPVPGHPVDKNPIKPDPPCTNTPRVPNATQKADGKWKLERYAHLHPGLCRAPDSAQRVALHSHPLVLLVQAHARAAQAYDSSADLVCLYPSSVCWEDQM